MTEPTSKWTALLDQWIEPSAPLAPATIDAAARLVADSLICGLAGAPLARSRVLRQQLLEAGGTEQAWVAGCRRKLPAAAAAMANAESMNLLDADDTFLNIGHFGSLIVAVALAEGTRTGADWARVCRAVAFGFDLNARLMLATRTDSPFLAPGLLAPGAALAAAISGGANADAVRNAVGLAMRFAPSLVTRALTLNRLTTIKYAPYGMLAQQAVFAARLAGDGYHSPDTFITEAPGFLRCQGAAAPCWDFLRPSSDSWIEMTSFKPIPSFRIGQPCVAAAISALADSGLEAGAIDRIELTLDPRARLLPFPEWPEPWAVPEIDRPIAASMNLRLSVACTVAGIPPGARWSEGETLARADVQRLYDRVVLCDTPVVPLSGLATLRDERTGLVLPCFGNATLHAGNHHWTSEVATLSGDPWTPGCEPGWGWLRLKESAFLERTGLVDAVAALAPNDDLSVMLDAFLV